MTVPPSPQSIVTVVEGKVSEATSGWSVSSWLASSWRIILAEFVATTLLLLLGCMTAIPIDGLPYPSVIYTPLGFGCVVMLNIQIFAHISGAHMNPAVSLAAVIWGNLPIPTAIGYVIAQCVGGITGYAILTALSPYDIMSDGVCATEVHPGLEAWQGLCIEIGLTIALNFTNCSVWDPVNKNRLDSSPLKFALVITGLSLAGGPFTGASMNPARSLGPAIFTGRWTHHWVYWLGPLIAGVLPPLFYKYILLKRDNTKTDE